MAKLARARSPRARATIGFRSCLPMKKPAYEVLDPVAAYDRVAPFFADMSQRRKPYLDRIDQLTLARVPYDSRSLLDVGAGDGKRALQIAGNAGLREVVLLEPSAEMIKGAAKQAEIWRIRAENLDSDEAPPADRDCRFDVITCLWNVLGHIRPAETRVRVLRRLGRLLSQPGRLFLDVHHRYNLRSYGLLRTATRFLQDQLWPGESNGDVSVSWDFADLHCRTYGHVFTDGEVRRVAAEADLIVSERLVVDYDTGDVKNRAWEGNLFYVLRRTSASDSSSL